MIFKNNKVIMRPNKKVFTIYLLELANQFQFFKKLSQILFTAINLQKKYFFISIY